MDFQSLKEYTRLNLTYNGLVLSKKEQETLAHQVQDLSRLSSLKNELSIQHKTVSDFDSFDFAYGNMSLTYWSIVCLSLLCFPIVLYLENGEPMIAGNTTWAFYIMPAILLVVRFFFDSFINIVHLILLVLCSLLTFLKISVLGSEVNWIWIFIIFGTFITIGARFWEKGHGLKKKEEKYHNEVQALKSLLVQYSSLKSSYCAVGANALKQMHSKFPGTKPAARTPWFDDSAYDLVKNQRPNVTQCVTSFLVDIVDINRSESNQIYRRTVTNHQRRWFPLSPDEAKQCIKNNLKPFFGMELPQHVDGLRYEIFRHTWDEHIYEKGIEYLEIKETEHTNRRADAKKALEDLEHKHLGSLALGYTPKTTADLVRYYDYLDKKDSILRSLPGERDEVVGIRTVEHPYERTYDHHIDEYAALTVTTPDGVLVGLYCSETQQSIDFAWRIAKEHWNAEPSIWLNPTSIQQRFTVFNKYFKNF